MQYSWLVWLILFVVFVVVEAFTVSLVSIWFCAGSLAALAVSLVFPNAYLVQGLAFLVVSGVSLLALRPLTRRWVDTKRRPTNADANIGKIGQVITEIQPEHFGRVRLEGLDWTAASSTTLPVGARCRVVSLDGVKLIVVPATAEDS